MTSKGALRVMLLSGALLYASMVAVGAAPPAGHRAASASMLQAQLKDVDAKIASARAHNVALQSQVAGMEQKSAAQRKLLQHRDAEIAALQHELAGAGAPASTASAGQ